MTRDETWQLIQGLKVVFDVVRLVDVAMMTQYTLDDEQTLIAEPYQCYAIWNKSQRRENCISAKAFTQRGKMCKFEFIDHEVYYVISMYVEVDEIPFALEMVSKVTDDTLFGTFGQNAFADAISGYTKKLYVDSLTGAYNRRYYEEQLQGLPNSRAVAMIDVDNFKMVNDTFGHYVGDLSLQAIVKTIMTHIRSTDAAIRYGGDEFLLVFREITPEAFPTRLERIRAAVNAIVLEEYPQLRLSVSIGGKYRTSPTENMLATADKLLYRAKEQKNKVVCE